MRCWTITFLVLVQVMTSQIPLTFDPLFYFTRTNGLVCLFMFIFFSAIIFFLMKELHGENLQRENSLQEVSSFASDAPEQLLGGLFVVPELSDPAGVVGQVLRCLTYHTNRHGCPSHRPCILIMDSLKLSHHERVFKLLRE